MGVKAPQLPEIPAPPTAEMAEIKLPGGHWMNPRVMGAPSTLDMTHTGLAVAEKEEKGVEGTRGRGPWGLSAKPVEVAVAGKAASVSWLGIRMHTAVTAYCLFTV